jgi:hypothetical protein
LRLKTGSVVVVQVHDDIRCGMGARRSNGTTIDDVRAVHAESYGLYAARSCGAQTTQMDGQIAQVDNSSSTDAVIFV